MISSPCALDDPSSKMYQLLNSDQTTTHKCDVEGSHTCVPACWIAPNRRVFRPSVTIVGGIVTCFM